ncbi:2-haloalkanoic acid dehalogenase [Thermococcus celericrescens]|uniref:2-haloalkanoic acid dehalogenase n=1 Tax=Thermococcus celericrescens TaxID=227598 RepID=A0A100XVL3_9EURY|nr:HAD family hydrolase [Thermococcus celericrescens]KUH31564.1 2-haloalkanoic acid dehalogenase [Thermococcus celericrescens]
MLRGLIFDVDETLVYYEGYDHREWYEKWVMPALRERGIELDYETYKKTVTGELPRSYVERFGIDHVEFWKIVDGVNLEYRMWMADKGKIKPFPDVNVLGELKELGLKLGAVSNASPECTEFVLDLFDLRRYFEVVYGKDYSNLDGVKPSPYLVEKALNALGLEPEEALMVGDSRHDVLAGKRAGMKVVNVTRFGEIEGADYYVKGLWELVELIRKML